MFDWEEQAARLRAHCKALFLPFVIDIIFIRDRYELQFKLLFQTRVELFAEITGEIFKQFLYESKALNEMNPKNMFLKRCDHPAF